MESLSRTQEQHPHKLDSVALIAGYFVLFHFAEEYLYVRDLLFAESSLTLSEMIRFSMGQEQISKISLRSLSSISTSTLERRFSIFMVGDFWIMLLLRLAAPSFIQAPICSLYTNFLFKLLYFLIIALIGIELSIKILPNSSITVPSQIFVFLFTKERQRG